MPQVSSRQHKNQNNSLSEDMYLPPESFTRLMLSPAKESASFGRPVGSMPTDLPGETDHDANPVSPSMEGGPSDHASVDADGFSTSPAVAVETSTEEIFTVITSMESSVVVIASPITASPTIVSEASEPLSASSTPTSSIVNQDTATVTDPAPSLTPSAPVSTYFRSIESSMVTLSVPTASSNLRTSLLTTPIPTAQTTPSSSGGLLCNNTYRCTAVEGEEQNHNGVIVGTVAGVLVAIICIFAAWLYWRWKRKRTVQRPHLEKQSAWHKSSRSDEATSTAIDLEAKDECTPKKHADHDIGEPGPAFYFGDFEATNTKYPDARLSLRKKRSSASTWANDLSNQMAVTADADHEDYAPRSDIGIALTRYPTAESTQPLSRPFSPGNYPAIPPLLRENFTKNHNRHSSMSAHSDTTTRPELDVVYVGKARTARRHSLARMINIAAGGSSSDKVDLNSKSDDGFAAARNSFNRDSIRSRSMSPNKLLSGYDNFVEGLSHHFHKDPSERPSLQKDRVNRSSTTKSIITDTVRYPSIPARGRSMKRAANHHISYPPTSYPGLGKTMSEVKRNIREKGEQAFASSEDLLDTARMEGRRSPRPAVELPGSVTIARGGQGK